MQGMSSMKRRDGRSDSHTGTLRNLMTYLWPAGETGARVRVVVAMLFLVLAKIANVYVPIVYARAVDMLGAYAGGPEAVAISAIVSVIVAYGLLRVLSAAFGELRDAVFAKVQQRVIRKVAMETFHHLHALSLRFHLDRQTGGLSRTIERGVRGIETVLRFATFNIVPTLFEIVLVAGFVWWLFGPLLAGVIFATIVAYTWFSIAFSEWRTQFRRSMNQSDSEANNKAVDSLLNYETVKYFGNEEHEARRYDEAQARYERAAVKSQVTLNALNTGQAVIIAVGLAVVMLLAALGVRDGTMTVGGFVLVNTYLIQLYLPLNFLGFTYREIKQGLVDMEDMFRLLDVEREVDDAPGAPALVVGNAEIRFEGVHFGYRPDREILKGISFTVPAGKKLAIVGPTGAGKSTISRLLFRFYDVTQGCILIDGQNIRDVRQASVRAAIGVVPQDTVLFNDTIGYNIAYGRPDASRDEIEQAARHAQVHDFVLKLPDGYETRVGERGLKLSGGEKQRVAIARTILKNPRILILDEATSALDTRTEQDIQQALTDVSRDRTTLVIAHRLSTVVDADEIIVLRDGVIVERGAHAALLAQAGLYARMWASQAEAAARGENLRREGPSARDQAENPAALS